MRAWKTASLLVPATLAVQLSPPQPHALKVWVLDNGHYVAAEQGTSGVACLIGRSVPNTFEPVCGDAAADSTTMATLATGPQLVSTSWLAAHVRDPNLVVLHVGPAGTYATHIPGASRTDLNELSVNPFGPTMDGTKLLVEMLPPDALRAKLESYGISDNSTVVVYAANDTAVVSATRVVFTLRVAGLGARAALLDGGLARWIAEKRPRTAEVPHPSPGHIAATPVPTLVVDADWVHTHLGRPKVVVIDARDRTFYDGSQAGWARDGHIAGARSLPYTEMFDSTGRYKSPAALKALFRQAGAEPGDTVVAYCHVGMQATAVLFAADQVGYPVRLYDGSFQDWANRTGLPVDDPAKRSK